MTTFQDKQPQSRRALRQEERAERPLTEDIDTPTDAETPRVSGRPTGRRARSNADGLIEVSGADSQETTTLHLPAAGNNDEASASTPAETSGSAAETTPAWSGPSFGFRSAGFDGSSIPPLAEPDDAENANEADQVAAEPLEDILAASPADDSSVARAFPFAAQVESTSDDDGHQTFLISDFAPSADHDSAVAEPAPADADAEAGEPEAVEPEAIEPEAIEPEAAAPDAVPVGEPISVSEPIAPVDPVVVEPEERTMTRREWRAWRAQQEAAASGDSSADESAPSAAPVFVAPVPAADPATTGRVPSSTEIPQLVEPQAEPAAALSDAMAEFEALTRGSQAASAPAAPKTDEPDPIVPAFPQPASSVAPPTSVASIFSVPTFSAPAAPEVQVPSEEVASPTASADEERAQSSDTTSEPTPSKQARAAQAPVEQPTAADLGSAQPATPDAEESAYVPPVGHWSRQAALDDESQPLENTLSRDVGGGNVATTTNALVLPMIPQRDDFSSMINSTGEIMVTGTIDLPMSVGATGRDSRHYDDPEVDHLFDAFDNEVATTDSAPVRAITAVSSHTATRSGIESTRKQGNRMLTVLIVTACVMAVGVVGLLVAGFVFDIFQA